MQMKKWLNNIKVSDKPVPQSYRPVMEAQEIVDVLQNHITPTSSLA